MKLNEKGIRHLDEKTTFILIAEGNQEVLCRGIQHQAFPSIRNVEFDLGHFDGVWQLCRKVEPPIEKLFMLSKRNPSDLFFAKRIGEKGEKLQLSTGYFNGGIGSNPETYDYEEVMRRSQSWRWAEFVEP